jgi:hypothetical protein
VRHKFPELLNFDSELMYIDKAAIGKWSQSYCEFTF